MNADAVMETDDFKKCVEFHGHICPGLAIGYKAAKAGMAYLKESRADDEEIVAVVETDACCSDAVQVLTGCTFGKGNFIYKDYGKMTFTFFSRNKGKGVRVSMRHGAAAPDDEHMKLIQKVIGNEADENEMERFQVLHMKRSRTVLEMPDDMLFKIEPVTVQPPPKAVIKPSKPCDACGEPVMSTKMVSLEAGTFCRECAEKKR